MSSLSDEDIRKLQELKDELTPEPTEEEKLARQEFFANKMREYRRQTMKDKYY